MNKEQGGKGVVERGLNFFEKLHYGLGAAALVGAAIVPEFSAPLIVFGSYELLHGWVLKLIKERVGSGSKQPAKNPTTDKLAGSVS
ncbi:MAG: hypothetical protein JWO96_826 [Candidatus Saccharibacteria bacterium]|nr:hypothetical protein [Candidatus Saccharibacteria bacterium]